MAGLWVWVLWIKIHWVYFRFAFASWWNNYDIIKAPPHFQIKSSIIGLTFLTPFPTTILDCSLDPLFSSVALFPSVYGLIGCCQENVNFFFAFFEKKRAR